MDDQQTQNHGQGERPAIYEVERSPLLQKAELFAKMLEEDNKRIKQLISEGRSNEVLIEKADDEEEEEVIEMVVCGPIYEANIPTPLPLDNTELPKDGWRPATSSTQK